MPSDIKTAYGLSSLALSGAGQTVALFEFDGYIASDLSVYASQAGVTAAPLQTVLVDGFNGKPSLPSSSNQDPGSLEVGLDIEMMLGLLPSATKILVYEGSSDGTESQFETENLDLWNKIASDDLASVVSSSWGLSDEESQIASSTLNGENNIFLQMAAQGQSVFVAAGDSGAYFPGTTLVQTTDPSDQPYICSVGGTNLRLAVGGTYGSETSWMTPDSDPANDSGGSGGISPTWPIPNYQIGLDVSTNMGSKTMRMIPDVSLDADPDTGYAVYYDGGWYEIGGTSAASPLWASFVALVNEQRAASGLGNLGFPNTPLYQIAASSLYATTFHDISDGSTNFVYPAVNGYDLTTGWGSFQGAALLSALVKSVFPPTAPISLTAQVVSQ